MFKLLLLSAALFSTSALALAQQAPQASKYTYAVQSAHLAARRAGVVPGVAPVLGGLRGSFSEQQTIVQNLQDVGGHTTLVRSAERAALIALLQGTGPFTVFAPTDAAFGRLSAGLLASLSQPANRAQLHALLATHIVTGSLLESDLTDGRVLPTLAGPGLTVRRIGGRVALEDARGKRAFIAVSNQTASNGVVHSLEDVLAQP